MLHTLLTILLLAAPVDPARLDPKWIEEAQKNGQMEETLEVLEALEEDYPHSARIQSNLRALPSAAKQQAIPPSPVEELKSSYTLDQYLQLAREYHRLDNRVEQEQAESDRLAARIAISQRYLDSLWLTYLSLNGRSSERLEMGLEIMAHQSALAIRKEGLRLLRDQLVQDRAALRTAKERLEEAGSRIDFSDWDEALLFTAKEQSAQQLADRQQQLAVIEARALEAIGTDQQKELETRAQQALIDAGLAEAELLFDQMTLFLFQYANGELSLKGDAIQDQIDQWQKRIDSLKEQSDGWNGSSEPLTALRGQLLFNQLILNQIQEISLARSSPVIRFLRAATNRANRFWNGSMNWVRYPLFHVHGVPFTFLSFLRILLILFIAWIISWIVRFWIGHLEKKRAERERANLYAIKRIAHYAIIIVGVWIALVSIGFNLDKLLIIAGALSVGIGFGLQGIANNFISGLSLLFERNVKIGDYIELETGEHAKVRAINIQNSVIRTFDGVDVIVPNSELTSKRLINWTMQDAYRRLHIPFGVAYGSDKETVREAAIEAAMNLKSTVSKGKKYPPPSVRLVEFGESSLNFELIVWINLTKSQRYGKTKAAYFWELETTLAKHGIQIPFPQRDIHIKEREEPSQS